MEAALWPKTRQERSTDALNAITRCWFPGYSWHTSPANRDGEHLTLLPDRKMRGIDEARLASLMGAFESAGLNGKHMEMKVQRHWLKAIDTSTAEIVKPNPDFLETHGKEIERRFIRRLQLSAGRYPVLKMTPDC